MRPLKSTTDTTNSSGGNGVFHSSKGIYRWKKYKARPGTTTVPTVATSRCNKRVELRADGSPLSVRHQTTTVLTSMDVMHAVSRVARDMGALENLV